MRKWPIARAKTKLKEERKRNALNLFRKLEQLVCYDWRLGHKVNLGVLTPVKTLREFRPH
jgi:hypothetical protein